MDARSAHARRGLTGAALAAAYAGWVVVAAWSADVSPWPRLLPVAVGVVAYVGGRLLGRHLVAVAAVVTLGAATALALTGAPFGYANADAQLAVQGAAAAALVVVVARRRWVRILAGLAGGLLALGATGSWAAGAGAALVVVATALAVLGRVRVRPLVLVGLLVAAVVATVGLAAAHDQDLGVPPVITSALSERRLDLWSDALDLAADHPLSGIGPEAFPATSPTALASRDTRQPHSAWLEAAAELGVPGAVLLLALACWPLLLLPGTRAGLVGAAAWTAFTLQASIDYVADFPTLVAVAALVVGLASASRPAARAERARSSPAEVAVSPGG